MMPELIFSLAKQEAASSILFHVVKAAPAPAAYCYRAHVNDQRFAIGCPDELRDNRPFRELQVVFARFIRIKDPDPLFQLIIACYADSSSVRGNAPTQRIGMLYVRPSELFPLTLQDIECIKRQMVLFPPAQNASTGGI